MTLCPSCGFACAIDSSDHRHETWYASGVEAISPVERESERPDNSKKKKTQWKQSKRFSTERIINSYPAFVRLSAKKQRMHTRGEKRRRAIQRMCRSWNKERVPPFLSGRLSGEAVGRQMRGFCCSSIDPRIERQIYQLLR